MNQSVKPMTAFVIVAVFALLLGGKFWAYGEAMSVRVFNFMHKHPNGTAYIVLGNQLYGFDQQGHATQPIDLKKFNADDNLQSDFAFFSNGDLLFRPRVSENSILQNLRNFMRLENQEDKIAKDDSLGLYRCELHNFSCRPFTAKPLNINDAFSLAIDWNTDRVFISDTSRHKVYLYSSQGEELATASGFEFPNQIVYQEQTLYVADTNHHRIAQVPVNDRQFEQINKAIDTRQGPAKQIGDIWPCSLLLFDQQLWVVNANDNMQRGGIYILTPQGDFKKRLTLPDNADPLELMHLNEQILVTDYSEDVIYRFDQNGEYLGNFEPAVMQTQLNTLKAKRAYYRQLEQIFLGLLIAALVSGFAVAIYQQYKASMGLPLFQKVDAAGVNLADPNIYWLNPKFKIKQILGPLAIVLFAFLIIIGFTTIKADQIPWRIFIKQGIILLLALYIFFIRMKIKIGILPTMLICKSPHSQPKIFPTESLLYSDQFISNTRDLINISTFNKIYSKEELDHYFYPFLKQGRFIDKNEMNSLMMRNKRYFYRTVAVIIAVIGYFIYLSLKSF